MNLGLPGRAVGAASRPPHRSSGARPSVPNSHQVSERVTPAAVPFSTVHAPSPPPQPLREAAARASFAEGGGAGGNPARPGLRGAARLPALGAGRLRLRKGAGLSLGRAAGEGRDDGEGAGRGRLTLLALAPTASGRGAGFADVAAGDAPCVCGRWLPRPGAPPPRRPACGAVAAAAVAAICGVSRAGGGGPRRGG